MKQPTRFIAFREKCAIVEKIDQLTDEMGTDRSAWVRAAIREKLAKTQ